MLSVMNKLWLTLILCAFFAAAASAAVYRWVDEDGNTIYSDTPHPDGEEIHQPPVQTYKAQKIPPKAAAPVVAKPAKYEAVEIVTPLADESIRDNTGEVVGYVRGIDGDIAGVNDQNWRQRFDVVQADLPVVLEIRVAAAQVSV